MAGELSCGRLNVLVVWTAHGQGTIRFETLVPEVGLDAPVGFFPGSGGVGPTWSAALYHVAPSGLSYLIPGSLTTFQDGSSDANLARYIVPRTVQIPGSAPGDSATVWMTAWLASYGSFEAAFGTYGAAYSEALIIENLGDASNPATLPPSFQGMVPVPEPSMLALFSMAGVVWLGSKTFRKGRNSA